MLIGSATTQAGGSGSRQKRAEEAEHVQTHRLSAHACRACPQRSGATQSMGAKISRQCYVPPHQEPVGHHRCQAQPLHKTPLASLLSWLSRSCLCSHTMQPALLAWASLQHCSRVQVPPPPLIHQQTRPTCPSQAPISPTNTVPISFPPPLAKAVRPQAGPGCWAGRRGTATALVGICPPSHQLPAPASPARQSCAPTSPPGPAASGGAAVAAPVGPAGKGGHCRWGPADVCQRAELLCQGALAGGCVDSQCSALHLPAPPVALDRKSVV